MCGNTMSRADPDSFVHRVTVEEKEVVIETDPDTFWQTDPYIGWPATSSATELPPPIE